MATEKVKDEPVFRVEQLVTATEPGIVGPDGVAKHFLEVLAQVANDTRIIREKLVGK
jgi:hypothetical protein